MKILKYILGKFVPKEIPRSYDARMSLTLKDMVLEPPATRNPYPLAQEKPYG